MDVTPTPKMFEAMQKFTDAIAGEEPGKLEQSVAANRRRQNRAMVIDFLHRFGGACMREGSARALNPYRTDLGASIANKELENHG